MFKLPLCYESLVSTISKCCKAYESNIILVYIYFSASNTLNLEVCITLSKIKILFK